MTTENPNNATHESELSQTSSTTAPPDSVTSFRFEIPINSFDTTTVINWAQLVEQAVGDQDDSSNAEDEPEEDETANETDGADTKSGVTDIEKSMPPPPVCF